MTIEQSMLAGAEIALARAYVRAKKRYDAAESPHDARRALLQAEALQDAIKGVRDLAGEIERETRE